MKENTLFKLDLLETYYLEKPARFGVTKQMMRSEKYLSKSKRQMSSKKLEKQKHKLLLMSKNEAFEMIGELKLEVFEKKLFFLETNITRCIVKVLKKEKQSLLQKLQSSNTDANDSIKAQVEAVDELLAKDSEVLKSNIKHKIFKEIIKHFPTYIDVKNDKFDSIPKSEISFIKGMKESNPYKTNGNAMNNVLSKVYAEKTVKQALDHVQTMEIIWGPKKYTKSVSGATDDNDDELTQFNEEGDDNEDEYDSNEDESEEEELELDDEAYEKLYEGYKDQLAASSDEEEDAEGFSLNPEINYNEITDEEASEDEDEDGDQDQDAEKDLKRTIEDDDFFATEEPTAKKPKLGMKDIQLPALATGYYSGGESDEEERNDAMVKDITEPRKNRRGQRARQKIWEKKYGKNAKHKVKEHERALSDRERLRSEYEVRKAKREEKQRVWKEREAEKEAKRKIQEEKAQKLHPSWEAKLKQQQSLKAKFSGKKVTFD